jgi:hypothetical protein
MLEIVLVTFKTSIVDMREKESSNKVRNSFSGVRNSFDGVRKCFGRLWECSRVAGD